MTVRLLACDVDDTLLPPEDTLQGILLDTLCALLGADVRLAILSDNDYTRSIRRRVVEPIPPELRVQLIVYADGCTRKIVYDSQGAEHSDADYYTASRFDPDDKPIVTAALLAEVDHLSNLFPKSFQPHISVVQGEEGTYQLRLGPLNTNNADSVARCDRVQGLLIHELTRSFATVEALPSDSMWIKIACSQMTEEGSGATPAKVIETTFYRLSADPEFLRLAKPSIIDRGEQLSLKPIRSATLKSLSLGISAEPDQTLRDLLIARLETKFIGSERQTRQEYQVLSAGRTTVNIQRQGVDKSFAMRNFIETQKSMAPRHVLYFGDAFSEGEGDRLVAGVEGVQCISVGNATAVPEGVTGVGGGPPVVLACLQSILWTLANPTDI
jgi:hypothetical protein